MPAWFLVILQILTGDAVELEDNELPKNSDSHLQDSFIVGGDIDTRLHPFPDRAEYHLKTLALAFGLSPQIQLVANGISNAVLIGCPLTHMHQHGMRLARKPAQNPYAASQAKRNESVCE
ncbi:hypothetical protein WM24_21135 [Burkholderia ubonensis]|nr:hypothetical protein WK08_28830 [Burkholderia ubonensis]KWN82076.1 hypothetical protein WM24_21135 [Burkholderia ubonensis]